MPDFGHFRTQSITTYNRTILVLYRAPSIMITNPTRPLVYEARRPLFRFSSKKLVDCDLCSSQ